MPAGISVFGVDLYAGGILVSAPTQSDDRGFARLSVPLPFNAVVPFGVAAQFFFIQPNPCGVSLFSASNALSL